jgi:predicted KAP-like P-loop ATPase
MTFLSDQETQIDLLYYESIAQTLVKLVRSTPQTPITVGVHGDWGAGKSSVLRMVESQLAKDKGILTVWFNGWAFEGYEDSKAVLIETLIEEIRRNRTLSAKARDLTKSLLKRVDYLKAAKKLGGLAFNYFTGLPSQDQLEALLKAGKRFLDDPLESIKAADVKDFVTSIGGVLKDPPQETLPEHVHRFRKEFEELIEAAGITQLVVLIDDLDRCLPETAIGTLEAIRLFLFVPKTAFVVAADEAMIEYAVRRHFPDLPATTGPQSYTRNYLEKLVQVPFRIPALGGAETRTYVTLLLVTSELADEDAQKLIAAGREDLKRPWQSRGLDAAAVRKALGGEIGGRVQLALDISQQVSRMLFDGTRGNPRQIKRFLNTLLLRHEIAEARGFGADIDRAVLAKLMLAERFEPTYYEELAREVAATTDGIAPSLAEAEGAKDKKKTGEVAAPARERAESARDEWVERWHTLRPALAKVDLRPYFFLTRDKRAFLGGFAGSEHLDALVERLMGSEVTARSASDAIKQLTVADADLVFDEVRSRMMQSPNMDKRVPPGGYGMRELVRGQPSLQKRLIDVLRDLPADRLGVWAAGHWEQCFTDPALKAEYQKQLEAWTQAGNRPLKAAIEAARKIGPKR